MATIEYKKLNLVKKLYYQDLLSMKKVSEILGVSMDALVYFMRKYDLKCRSVSENEKIKFARKPLSFSHKKLTKDNQIKAMGAMLYWAEGAKGGLLGTCNTVDFANSDPSMVRMFLNFLRTVFSFDEKRLRCLLYCYANQDQSMLKKFWSKETKIPLAQFTKPYIRTDFRKDGRKMKYGLVHIRYNDKKLLIEIENMIDYYVQQYAPIV